MKNFIFIILLTLSLSACGSNKLDVLKSPCVGIDDSPCGPKRPANQHIALA